MSEINPTGGPKPTDGKSVEKPEEAKGKQFKETIDAEPAGADSLDVSAVTQGDQTPQTNAWREAIQDLDPQSPDFRETAVDRIVDRVLESSFGPQLQRVPDLEAMREFIRSQLLASPDQAERLNRLLTKLSQ